MSHRAELDRRQRAPTGNGWPRISIITPSYNQAEWLGQTIRSVLDQSYPNLEYIVIDGGSTDGSVEILRSHESRLAYWVSEADKGQTHAINKGIARASGEIIAYLNSDDYYLPGSLLAVAEAYRRNPAADLFFGRCRYVDASGSRIGGQFGSISSFEEILDVWNVWWKQRQFVQPEVFWTRRITDKVGPFTEHLNFVMDYDYWARIFRAGGKAVGVDRELTAFRFTPNQKSNQSEAVAAELLGLIRPWLWDRGTPISSSTRRRLQRSWLYHGGFLKLRDDFAAAATKRPCRWIGLLGFVCRHPTLLAAPQFWENLKRISSSKLNSIR